MLIGDKVELTQEFAEKVKKQPKEYGQYKEFLGKELVLTASYMNGKCIATGGGSSAMFFPGTLKPLGAKEKAAKADEAKSEKTEATKAQPEKTKGK